MQLAENQAGSGSMPGPGDRSAADLPAMTHQLVAPAATCIEPDEYPTEI